MNENIPVAAEQTLDTFQLVNTFNVQKERRASRGDSFLKSFLTKHLPDDARNKLVDMTYESRALDNAVSKAKKKSASVISGRVKKRSVRIRELSKLELKREYQEYDIYLPMHNLWKDYMRSIVNFKNLAGNNLKSCYPHLLKADYHGCLIKVLKSKCPSYVDASGIVIQETKNMFRVITRDNKLKSFPKANSVFTFDLDGYRFTIYGNQFRYKSGERVSKQFKARNVTLDL